MARNPRNTADTTAGAPFPERDFLAFERLVSSISARLFVAPPEAVDDEILQAIESVRVHFGVDRCGLLRVLLDRGHVFVSHGAFAPGVEPIPPEVNLQTLFPEVAERLIVGGEVSRTADAAALPPSVSRDTYLAMGTRSSLEIPLKVGGAVRYILAINDMRAGIDWPEEYIPRIRLVGELFVNALERRRGDQRLRESEELLRLAARCGGIGFWSLEPGTGALRTTESTRTLFGFTPDDEATLERFLDRVHPDDAARVREAIRDSLQDHVPYQVDFRVLLPSGAIRWLSGAGGVHATVAGDRLMGAILDVTERAAAEMEVRGHLEHVSAAADVARMAFYEVDWGAGRVILGAGGRELLGIRAEEDPRAREVWFSRIHPEDRERVREAQQEVTGGPGRHILVVYRYLHPVHGEVWFRHAARSLSPPGPTGEVVRSVGVVLDMTDQKVAEEELRRTLKEVERLRDEYRQQNVILREQIRQDAGRRAIVGESEPMLRLLEAVARVAPTDSTVLVTGETGTGKELVAEAIHEASARCDRPMVRVNCAALPAPLIESELFGRERGAYTGAMTRQEGRFEQADGSTLFLDEISELSPEVQPKLLRVLQDGTFERLGGRTTHKVDVRVVAATNRDLATLVSQGRFRADLFYRLSVFPIAVPPLRERRDDIPLLVWSFVRHFARKMGKSIDSIPRQTLERFQRHPWPGNVRELRNLIERSVILTDNRVLSASLPEGDVPAGEAPATLQEAERRHILSALDRSGWRIRGAGGAAERLGLNPTTLHSKMKKLRIARP